ncbi:MULTISPECIES: hypothetical protein [Micrococcaceae]|uniref:Nucleoside 2-deoxyribosyltransferase n=1 Tax=Pseudarthrobacter siccitolerans TaxID=861266 RepID=A0ABU0PKC9_9MICC|nr:MULTISPECIES: hypothetical protein [Micrococcaceae]MDQ0674433.1 hypothetical protein [Pseudarthrobacter siccitolerans]MDQ0689345.1 hypothetical protein [Arthrobacter sp. W4I7]
MPNYARVTNPEKVQPVRKSVFIVSPIGVPGSEVYRKAMYALKYIFREALKGDEWEVHRADEGKSPDSIGQHVIRKLYEADLVVADLTGHNPNVFYELAIAHGWRKPVVHLISKGETVPFDIVDQRTIFYDITDLASVEEAVKQLREYAEYAISNTQDLVTPLTSFEMFSQIRADTSDSADAVADVLEQVLDRLSRIEATLVGASQVQRPERTGASAGLQNQYKKLQIYAETLRALDNRSKQDTLELYKVENEMAALLGRSEEFAKLVEHANDAKQA